jgi:hypothetical protein
MTVEATGVMLALGVIVAVVLISRIWWNGRR